MAAVAGVLRRRSVVGGGLAFAVQALIACSVEVGDDVARGIFSQHGTVQGIHNAQEVVAFEQAHGFWVEPAWQVFFEQPHHILVWTLTWLTAAHVMNTIYVFGHLFVTLGVALWVYAYHRR